MLKNREKRTPYKTMIRALAMASSVGLLSLSLAWAQLDEIVITATRSERTPLEVPQMIESIQKTEIREQKMPSNMVDLFKETPGVMVQKTGRAQGSPYIRGFTGFRNVFLIDGVRLNNSVFRSGPNQYWNTVDPLAMDRVEVLKGSASVLYGSDAIGGAVQAISKEPSGKKWQNDLLFRYASAEDSRISRYDLSAEISEHLSLVGGFSLKRFGELKTGDSQSRLAHTDYDEWAGDFKLIYNWNKKRRLIFAHQSFSQDDAWRTHKTIYSRSFSGTSVGNEKKRSLDQDRRLSYLKYESKDHSFFDRFSSTLSYQEQDEKRFRIKKDDTQDLQGFEVGTLGWGIQAEKRKGRHGLSIGLDYYRDKVSSFKKKFNADGSFKSESIQGPVGDDAKYELLDVFALDEITLTEKFELLAGVRFTRAQAQANEVEDPVSGQQIQISKDWQDFVSSLRLLFYPEADEHWSLFASLAQSYRAPNLSDLTRLDEARSSEIETPSPNLNPEDYLTFEVGSKFIYENWSGSVSYFYTKIKGMIVRTPTGKIIGGDSEVTKVNSGDGYIQGVEIDLHRRLSASYELSSSVAWQDGEIDTFPTSAPVLQREPLDRLMPTTLLFSLKWQRPSSNFWIESLMTVAQKQDKLSTRDRRDTQRIPPGGTPSYTVFSVRSGWEASDKAKLFLALENLTDKDYRVHGSGQNEAGLNAVIGLNLSL